LNCVFTNKLKKHTFLYYLCKNRKNFQNWGRTCTLRSETKAGAASEQK